MAVLTLLLTRDREVLRILERILQELSVGVVLTDDLEEAAELLETRKFDGFIVDCENVPGSGALVHSLRQGSSNRSIVVFALTAPSGSARNLFELGANFVLEKPLQPGRTLRCFRAAQALMVRERRRYFRCELETSVTLDTGDGAARSYTMLNLSEGGLAIRAAQSLRVGAAVKLAFTLPDPSTQISAKGEVIWVGGDGQAGLRLAAMSDTNRIALCTWLARAMETQPHMPVASISSNTLKLASLNAS